MNVKTDAFSMNSSDSAGSFSLFQSVDRLAGEGRHEQIRGLFHDEECGAKIRQDRSIFRRALEAAIHALATDSSPASHARDLADLIRLEADLVDDTRRHVADHLRKLFSKQAISLEDVRWLGPRTRTQLDVQGSTEIKIELVHPQWLGRFRYYNNHLDDATRFTFRIGFWGLILGVASILLSAAGFLKLP